MSKNKRLAVIKASRSRGVIDAININIGDEATLPYSHQRVQVMDDACLILAHDA
jgi:hypothetical protein